MRVFAENDFKYRPRLGVNRGHKYKRIDTMNYLLEERIADPFEWYCYYADRDVTTLMTTAENRRSDNNRNPVEPSRIIDIDDPDLFPDGNFCWRHGPKEIEWLKRMAAEYLSQ